MATLLKKRHLIARMLIALMLFVPLSSVASVVFSSDHQSGHCLEQAAQQKNQSIDQLVQKLCTMDERIELCETLFHCSSHSISITSTEFDATTVQPESLVFRNTSSPHPSYIQYNLFRPPRH